VGSNPTLSAISGDDGPAFEPVIGEADRIVGGSRIQAATRRPAGRTVDMVDQEITAYIDPPPR
jgi:hypothetical protein